MHIFRPHLFPLRVFKRSKRKLLLGGFAAIFSLGLTACGGGGSSSSDSDSSTTDVTINGSGSDSTSTSTSTSTPNSVTGRFIDDPVQGLGFECSSGSTGITNEKGEYTCNEGDQVTFSLGGKTLGTVPAQADIITPYSLFPDNQVAALNVARLLQTVDADGDPNNGVIAIDSTLTLPAALDFASPNFTADIQTLLAKDLVSPQAAQAQLHSSIANEGSTVPETVNLVPEDTTPPVISITGDNPLSLVVGGAFSDLGATATDSVDGNVIVTRSGSVDTATAGSYTLTYTATDSSNNTATATRVVNVSAAPDTTPPVITLNGSSAMTLSQNAAFSDPGATATDDVDGTVNVSSSGSVNTAAPGSYTIVYTASDSAGNTATATRTVTINALPVVTQDTTPPVITVLGDNPTVISQDDNYSDAGAVALDDMDGTVEVQTSGVDAVDTSTKGEYKVTYTARDSAGNQATATRTVQVNSVAAAISIENILIAAHVDDPGVTPTALKAGNVYNFVIEFSSDKPLDDGVTFTLVLMPDVSSSLTEGNAVSFELGADTVYLDSDRSEDNIPAGPVGLYIDNVMIPKPTDTSKNYILMAYLHEGELLEDGYEINLGDSSAAKTDDDSFDPTKLVEDIAVRVLPKTDNDVALDAVYILDQLAFIENDKEVAIVDGYMDLPFVDSELEFFSNNDSDAEITLQAYWTTPTGEDVPLYFYDENSTDPSKMVDHEKVTVPSSKRAAGDVVSRIAPYIYPAELYLDEAGWEKMLQYAGDPTKGEEAFQAKVKFQIESSTVNENNKNDTIEVTQFTLELDSLLIEDTADKAARLAYDKSGQHQVALQKDSVLFSGDDEVDHDVFDYKKEWSKDWGNKSKVALELAAGVNGGVDLVPVPTIDAVGAAGIYLHLFDNKNKMVEYRLQFHEGLNIVIDDDKNKKYKFKRGLENTFTLFNVVINKEGEVKDEEADKNSKDSETIDDAKKQVEKGTFLEKLVYEKKWEQEKELFSKTFTVGPVPIKVSVGVKFEMPLNLGLQPNGFGLELFANIGPKVEVVAKGGVSLLVASAGVKIDFLIVETTPSAKAGLQIVYKSETAQFIAQLYTEGELPIEAVKGTFSLYAETGVSYPCGWSWFKNIKWCKKTKEFSFTVYSTPAVVDRTGDNAIKLWEYKKPLITLKIPTSSSRSADYLPNSNYLMSCQNCEVSNGF